MAAGSAGMSRRCDAGRCRAQGLRWGRMWSLAAGQSTAFERPVRTDRLIWMALELHEHAGRPGRNVRLDTLVRLRWVAVIGQTTAVLVVHYGLGFELPVWACLAVIALAGWLNVALRVRFHVTQR